MRVFLVFILIVLSPISATYAQTAVNESMTVSDSLLIVSSDSVRGFSSEHIAIRLDSMDFYPKILRPHPYFGSKLLANSAQYAIRDIEAPTFYNLPRWVDVQSHIDDNPGLLRKEEASIGISNSIGSFSYAVNVGGVKYLAFMGGVTTQYFVSGEMRYRINNNIGFSAFGSYYSKAPFFGEAAYPYVYTTNFGGYISISPSEAWGIDLGARSYYDTLDRRMEVDPIVAPYVKIKKVRFQMDFGHALKQGIGNLFRKWSR